MSNIEKIIEKMNNQPNGIRMQEADKALMSIGYRFDRQKGSHRQYINATGNVITVKADNVLKACYIKDILKRVQEG